MQPDELQIKRISYAELREIERFIGMPQPPTYEYIGAGGAKAVRRHNETTLQSQEDLEKWESYETSLRAFYERRDYFIASQAVENVTEVPPDWVAEQERKPWVKLPESDQERLGYYILHEICQSPDEYNDLISRILEKSGFITTEEISQKAKGF